MAVILVVLLSVAFDPSHPLPSMAVVAMLGLQVVHSLPRLKWLRGPWSLAAQALLFPWAGPGAPGLLAASVLLIAGGPIRWVMFAGVVAAAGLLNLSDAYGCANAMGNALAQGLIVFGVTRLSDLRAELHAARGEPAAESVAGERERASRDLDAVLGSSLSAVIGLAAKGRTEEIVVLGREAAARARETPGAAVELPRGDLTPRLALPIHVAAHAGFLIVSVIYLWQMRPPAWVLAGALLAVAGVVGLQLYHSLPRPPGVRPRHAAWTLPVQLALACLPLLSPDRPYPQLAGFAAASVLIVMCGNAAWAAWPISGAIILGVCATLLLRGVSPVENLYWTFNAAAVAAMLYGLALHTGLVFQVREARLALAEIAVVKERRRISRDVHDLLGSSLSAIVVKGELAVRTPERAERELADIARIARRALADLRAIPRDDDPGLSLDAELASAREILTAAGVTVHVDASRRAPVPSPVDALLATVLREAVTNVLRHSRADHCRIEVACGDGLVRLRVRNDGAPADGAAGAPGERAGGQGITNLAERVAAVGGRLAAAPTGGGYELSVLQPVGLGGDTDGVEAVAGV
ncbi:histidine kinase [Streptosporangium canum]|uniref:sensor histidine kinase n=1 Tax=Streptosporangium canum TaxID=324952 RepID=UPI00343538D3